MKTLFNILMAIIVWYVPQFIVGFIMGFGASMMGYSSVDEIMMPLLIVGILVSGVSEIVYWTHYISKGRA